MRAEDARTVVSPCGPRDSRRGAHSSRLLIAFSRTLSSLSFLLSLSLSRSVFLFPPSSVLTFLFIPRLAPPSLRMCRPEVYTRYLSMHTPTLDGLRLSLTPLLFNIFSLPSSASSSLPIIGNFSCDRFGRVDERGHEPSIVEMSSRERARVEGRLFLTSLS